MDEVRIGSELFQGFITRIFQSLIRKKLGIEADLQFNDPLTVSFDGDKAHAHLNLDAVLSRNDLEKLLKQAG